MADGEEALLSTGFLLLLGLISTINASYVQELDESFSQLKKEGSWLVEFYAPWCGYCRKLEPIWENVGKNLYGSSIHVAKLDATVYSSISREYNVRGFPTIKFIKGDNDITYHGDRSLQDIIQFAEKAGGPAVKELTSGDQLRTVQRDRTVFFLFVQSSLDIEFSTNMKNAFIGAAEKKITEAYFYSILDSQLPKGVKLKSPVISVFKDGSNFPLEASKELTSENVTDWVDREKFNAFVQITRSNIHDISETGKAIVIVVFAEDKQKKKQNEKVGKVVKEVALKKREKFHSSFQTGWVLGDEITTNIMMSSIKAPYILVYNGTDFLYYLKYYEDVKDGFDEEKMVAFLENIQSGEERSYGGDSYFQRFIRMLYSFFTTIYDIWSAQPIIATIMFGIPAALFSFIIYMLCTAEAGDDQEFNDYDDDDNYDDDETNKMRSQPLPEEAEVREKPKTE